MSRTKLRQQSMASLTNPTDALQFLAKRVLGICSEVVAHESPVAKQTEPSSFFPSAQRLVTEVSNFGVLDILLVGLPESLNTPGALVLVAHVVTPGTLNTSGHIVPIPISHRLQCKELKVTWSVPLKRTGSITDAYRLWVLDEGLRNTHLPFFS